MMSEHVMSLFREPIPVPVLGASILLQSEKNKNQRYPSLVAPRRPNDTRYLVVRRVQQSNCPDSVREKERRSNQNDVPR